MGSISMHREAGQTDREFWQGELLSKYKIIDCATIGRTVFYAAVETTEGPDAGMVGAFVALQQWTRDWHNFTYKSMTEDAGPNAAECPARILDKLTELPECWKRPHRQWDCCGLCNAREWRAECRKLAERRARAAKVKAGQVVRFARPVKFASGAEVDTLTFDKLDIFHTDEQRYRVTGWRAMDWELVPA
jgi:hypothetical protein